MESGLKELFYVHSFGIDSSLSSSIAAHGVGGFIMRPAAAAAAATSSVYETSAAFFFLTPWLFRLSTTICSLRTLSRTNSASLFLLIPLC